MNRHHTTLAALLLVCAAMAPALAQSDPGYTDQSPWQFRARVLGVIPDSSGSTIDVKGVPSLSSPNSGLSISNSVVPEVDATYFFTPNIAAELIAGVTPHDINGTGAISGLSVGRTWLLPPTLTAQYHLRSLGAFQPYAGVGVNYTIFFDQHASNATNAAGLDVTNLHIKNAASFALQFGFDYMLDQHWGINLDAKKLFLQPGYTAVVNHAIDVSGTAHIDAWVTGVGITYRL